MILLPLCIRSSPSPEEQAATIAALTSPGEQAGAYRAVYVDDRPFVLAALDEEIRSAVQLHLGSRADEPYCDEGGEELEARQKQLSVLEEARGKAARGLQEAQARLPNMALGSRRVGGAAGVQQASSGQPHAPGSEGEILARLATDVALYGRQTNPCYTRSPTQPRIPVGDVFV